MNNLSYCGLVDAKIRASDKDLPICIRKKIAVHILFAKMSEKEGCLEH